MWIKEYSGYYICAWNAKNRKSEAVNIEVYIPFWKLQLKFLERYV